MQHIEIIQNIKDKISNYDTIGVFSSGGFDSTVLLYLVIKIIKDNFSNKKLTVYTVNRTDDSKSHSERVLEHLGRIFNLHYTHITYIDDAYTHHSKQISSGIMQVINVSTLLILCGTRNPNEASLCDGSIRIKSTVGNIYQPFIDGDKTVTISIEHQLGILELVSTISHTCTESIALRCDACWQRRERSWAFQKLELIDVRENVT